MSRIVSWLGGVVILLFIGWDAWYTFHADVEEWLSFHDRLGGSISGLAILFAVSRYIAFQNTQKEELRRAAHERAWLVINSAQGTAGNSGRLDAVARLGRDGVVLDGINLDGAWLAKLRLPSGASLDKASLRPVGNVPVNLSGAHLLRSHFCDANMYCVNASDARMNGALLLRTDLTGARLTGADLAGAYLSDARLHSASLDRSSLPDALLINTVLHNAFLYRANARRCCFLKARLEGANLTQADLQSADLREIRWDDDTVVTGCNLFDVRDPPLGFLEWALAKGAIQEKRPEPQRAQQKSWRRLNQWRLRLGWPPWERAPRRVRGAVRILYPYPPPPLPVPWHEILSPEAEEFRIDRDDPYWLSRGGSGAVLT